QVTTPAPKPAAVPTRPAVSPPTGRVLPPTLRLRVEDPKTGQAPPSPPRRPGPTPGYRPPPPRPAGPRPGSGGGARREGPRQPMSAPMPAAPPPVTRTITLAEGMTVADLATKLDVKAKDVLRKLMDRRLMMTI